MVSRYSIYRVFVAGKVIHAYLAGPAALDILVSETPLRR